MIKPILLPAIRSPEYSLSQLQHFRWGLVVFELAAALFGWLLEYPVVSWSLLLLLIALHAVTNIISYYLSARMQDLFRLLALLCLADLLLISLMLALSGGASNGFVSLLLLPVATAAVLLPSFVSYLLALIAIVVYSLLLLLDGSIFVPVAEVVPHLHAGHQHVADNNNPHFGQHLFQMWLAFSLSVVLVSWFISEQAKLIRVKSEQLSQLQQQQIHQEQVLAIATYAANAAHDLATPIQNMALLADELQSMPHSPSIALSDLQAELRRCQQIVERLRQNATELKQPQQPQPLLPLLKQTLQSWLVSRPDISLQLSERCNDTSGYLITESISLSAALFNILDNAAQASLNNQQPQLDVLLVTENDTLCLVIRDYGEGLSEQRLSELGKIPQYSEQGLGLGQFLANVSIERLGGKIYRCNLPDCGAETRIVFRAQIQDKA